MRAGAWLRGGATVLLVAVSVTVLSGSSSPAHPADSTRPPSAVCHPASRSSAAAPARPISARIPRVVAVQLDRDGHPVRLWTNTGTCPRGDEQIVIDGAGHPTRATSALRREIARHVYRGDWSQVGAWHTW